MPPGDVLKKIRQEIDFNAKPLHKIVDNNDFKKYFGKLDEEYKLKTTPKGYDKDHPEIEYLRLTSFLVWHNFSDKELQSKSFAKELGKASKMMRPFLDFLN